MHCLVLREMSRGSQVNNPEVRHRLDRDDVGVWNDFVVRNFRLRNFFLIVFILLYRCSGCQATAAAMATPIATDGDTLNAQRVAREYCNMEMFNATCRPGHVLFIEAARYGRMNIGRCVRSSYGYLGCAADARRFMDGRCSGRRHCRFTVPDPSLYAMQPCPGDFTSYLETTYSCIEASYGDKATCDRFRSIRVTSTSGYFTTSSSSSSAITDVDRGPGSASCPWIIEAQRGQRINLTLFNFADIFGTLTTTSGSGTAVSENSVIQSSGNSQKQSVAADLQRWGSKSSAPAGPEVGTGNGYGAMRPDVCFEIAEVIDGDFGRKKVTVCGEDRRQSTVLWSRSNVVRIELANPKLLQSIGAFMFHYQVTGCADVRLTGDLWLQQSPQHHPEQQHHHQQEQQQQQQHAVLRCNATDEMWSLTCRDGRWIGDVGNCSGSSKGGWSLEHMINQENTFPIGVLLAVTIGVAMGVVIGGIMLCLLTMYMKRHRRNLAGYSQPKEQRDVLAGYQHQMTAASTGLTPSSAGGPSPFLGSLNSPPPPGTGSVIGAGNYRHQYPQYPQYRQQQQQSPYSSTSSTATGISTAYYFRRAGSTDPSVGPCCGGTVATRSMCSGEGTGSTVLTTFGVGSVTGNSRSTNGSGIDSMSTTARRCDVIEDASSVACYGNRTAPNSGDVGMISGSGDTSSSVYVDDVVGMQTIVAPPFGLLPSSRQQTATTCLGGGNGGGVLQPKTYIFSGQMLS